jgi:hypothetical protein
MVEVIVAGTIVAGAAAVVSRRQPGLPRVHMAVPKGPRSLVIDGEHDLPCPWCKAATTEADSHCPSCRQRFG